MGYATYIAVDVLTDGNKDTFAFIFFNKQANRPESLSLKEGATFNGNPIEKITGQFKDIYVVKNKDKRLSDISNAEDIKKLFNFWGKGTVKLDISQRSLETQYKNNSFFYIVLDELEDGTRYFTRLIVT